MKPTIPRLSKSKFMSGLQCHKRLYLEIHQPELATETDDATQAILDAGTEVGRVARGLFPGGVLVEHDHEHLAQALDQTAALLKDPTVQAIFEGTFVFDGVLVRVDVLKRIGHGRTSRWRLIEVKAATQVKDEYYDDLAIQTYVLKGAGVNLAGSWLMYLNNEYVYAGGELDLAQLFRRESLTADVTRQLPEVPHRLAEFRAMLVAPEAPMIEPDGHCKAPYHCQFWDHCTKDKPERWVFHLPRVGQKFDKLRAMGIESIDDIPDEFSLSDHQQLVKEGKEWVDAGLKAALTDVRYPVHHLDFETIRFAIPKYPGTRPYQQVPFQWSNHIETGDGQVEHHEYLHTDRNDPREALVLSLLKSLGSKGSICVYSGFEGRVIRELSEAFPKLRRELDRLLERLHDLYGVVRSHYFHPGFGSSYSLKAVLPALLPAMDYGDLAIQEGDMASNAYAQMLYGGADPTEQARIKANLLAYCGRDTEAMVELRRFLWGRAEGLLDWSLAPKAKIS